MERFSHLCENHRPSRQILADWGDCVLGLRRHCDGEPRAWPGRPAGGTRHAWSRLRLERASWPARTRGDGRIDPNLHSVEQIHLYLYPYLYPYRYPYRRSTLPVTSPVFRDRGREFRARYPHRSSRRFPLDIPAPAQPPCSRAASDSSARFAMFILCFRNASFRKPEFVKHDLMVAQRLSAVIENGD